jgi:pimeloyl-ACP methyl ester carboxylesterase
MDGSSTETPAFTSTTGWHDRPMSVFERSGRFSYEGRSLAYSDYGEGPRTVVLLHGVLLSRRMHEPLARSLAERGNRVITLDLLGHGASDRPVDPACYSMTFFGKQMIALLDHLRIEEAVVLGTSLGANAALEVAAFAPERLRGMIIEMPVLDGALLACALVFTPLMIALSFGEPMMRVVQFGARQVPKLPWLVDFLVDFVRQDPAPGAAVLQGLFFGRIAPHRAERRTLRTETLVIGHRRDPVHPFSDAGTLAEELPNARLLEASSIVELRLAPKRLTDEIAAFIDDCWKPRRAARKPARAS